MNRPQIMLLITVPAREVFSYPLGRLGYPQHKGLPYLITSGSNVCFGPLAAPRNEDDPTEVLHI